MATTKHVLAWLDERGWPHDPRDWTKVQDREVRSTLGICGHRNRKHLPCAFPPMANGRCSSAGGKSRKGMAHPNYQGKGQGRYVLPRWQERFRKLRKGTELLDLTDQLAFVTLRIEDLMQRVDPAETGKTWGALRQEWGKLQRALKDPSPEGTTQVRECVLGISALVARGSSDAEAWDEIYKVWEVQRRAADTETKRRVLAKLFIKAEDAMEDYDYLARAMKDTLTDMVNRRQIERKAADRVLMNVSERFAKLVALPDLPEPAERRRAG